MLNLFKKDKSEEDSEESQETTPSSETETPEVEESETEEQEQEPEPISKEDKVKIKAERREKRFEDAVYAVSQGHALKKPEAFFILSLLRPKISKKVFGLSSTMTTEELYKYYESKIKKLQSSGSSMNIAESKSLIRFCKETI